MLISIACTLALMLAGPDDRPTVLVVVGAEGTPEYGAEFRRWADLWVAAASKGQAETIRIGDATGEGPSDRDRLRDALAAKVSGGPGALWLVLIGHGTFDGREAKFNLRGPDVSEADLAGWLESIKAPVAVLDGSSASGPFLARLSAKGRVVVTATRIGNEQNFARLGQYLAEAIADPGADLDKDGQVSLLEAFLKAGGRVEEFYKSRSRLATEHALIDDNGDRFGTPAAWFRGVRATKRARDGAELDGLRAHQFHLILGDRERTLSPAARQRRDQLEQAAAALRAEKATLPEDEYYRRLEAIMVELARLYRDAVASTPAGEATAPDR